MNSIQRKLRTYRWLNHRISREHTKIFLRLISEKLTVVSVKNLPSRMLNIFGKLI
jgi:hypothetical protein